MKTNDRFIDDGGGAVRLGKRSGPGIKSMVDVNIEDRLASVCVVLIAQAGEAAPAGDVPVPADGGFLQQFFGNPINLILISLILFFILVAQPQRKQMKKHQQMLANLKKNDRIVTASGIHGVVVSANAGEATVSIRIDDSSGARMTINRDSIATVVPSGNSEAKG